MDTARIINRKFENVVVYFQFLSIFLKKWQNITFIVKISAISAVAQLQTEVMFLGKVAALSLTECAVLVRSGSVLIKTEESQWCLLNFEIIIDLELTSW